MRFYHRKMTFGAHGGRMPGSRSSKSRARVLAAHSSAMKPHADYAGMAQNCGRRVSKQPVQRIVSMFLALKPTAWTSVRPDTTLS